MTAIVAGLVGGALGLLVALFARTMVLPYVLQKQEHVWQGEGRLVLGFLRPDRLKNATIWVYKYWMPVLFPVVFASCAVIQFGGVR